MTERSRCDIVDPGARLGYGEENRARAGQCPGKGARNVIVTALGLALGLFGPMWGFCVPFVRFYSERRIPAKSYNAK
jgi:hypothetical protein